MFANRAFNIALMISFTWHVLCMSLVNIVVLPGKYKMRDLTSVSFLGPILEETALNIMLANKPEAVITTYQYSLRDVPNYVDKEDAALRDKIREEAERYVADNAEDRLGSALNPHFKEKKEMPNFVKRTARPNRQPKPSSAIDGTAAGREIIYKPKIPKLPSRIDAGTPFTMELEFWISAQGEVKKIVPVVSSGNPEVDLLGIRYMKAWKFAPTTEALQEEQNGKIKLVFSAREEKL